MTTFVAIDFETATTRRDSACAVGLAAGCDGRIVVSRTYLTPFGRPARSLRSATSTAWAGRTCATPRPSPSCGRRSAPGSTTRRSSPPTTRRSTGASCTPVARGTGCAPRGRRSPAPCSSPARSGGSVRRSCPTCAAGCASRSVTTTRNRTRWRARASCSRPRPMVGGRGSIERAGQPPAPWSAPLPLSTGRGGRAGCAGRRSYARSAHGGNDCAAASERVCGSCPDRRHGGFILPRTL